MIEVEGFEWEKIRLYCLANEDVKELLDSYQRFFNVDDIELSENYDGEKQWIDGMEHAYDSLIKRDRTVKKNSTSETKSRIWSGLEAWLKKSSGNTVDIIYDYIDYMITDKVDVWKMLRWYRNMGRLMPPYRILKNPQLLYDDLIAGLVVWYRDKKMFES